MEDLQQPFSYTSSFYPGDRKVHVFGYSDADYANNVDDRKSITGYVFVFAGAPLSWNSMTQHSVALSTMEAEYYAVCKATQEAIYLRMLFEESGMKVEQPLVIKEDNQACISFTKQPGDHTRTKHIDVRSCFVRRWVEHGELVLEQIDTSQQLADIFTKALDTRQFQFLRDHLVRPRSSVEF
jgi:enoyl reductase-like protein